MSDREDCNETDRAVRREMEAERAVEQDTLAEVFWMLSGTDPLLVTPVVETYGDEGVDTLPTD